MSGNFQLWSQTASSNDIADPTVNWAEGMSPGAVNNSARALMAALASNRDDTNGSITTGGTTPNYTFTSAQTIGSYLNNTRISIKASFTNAGACNLNLNTLGAKAIKVFDSGAEADPVASQIITNGRYDLEYDTAANAAAGAWILLNPTPDPTSRAKIGEIKLWTSNAAPTGYVLCYGQQLSQTTFAALFAIVGTTFNTGGETAGNFRVPDLRGRIPAGKDDMGGSGAGIIVGGAPIAINGSTLGATGGAASVVLTAAQLASHSHTGTTDNGGVAHTHSGTTNSQDANHTHSVAPGTPSGSNGTFTGPGGTGWSGTVGTATSGIESGAHSHPFTTGAASATNHTHTFTTATAGSDSAHTNMPPLMILNYIIKTG